MAAVGREHELTKVGFRDDGFTELCEDRRHKKGEPSLRTCTNSLFFDLAEMLERDPACSSKLEGNGVEFTPLGRALSEVRRAG